MENVSNEEDWLLNADLSWLDDISTLPSEAVCEAVASQGDNFSLQTKGECYTDFISTATSDVTHGKFPVTDILGAGSQSDVQLPPVHVPGYDHCFEAITHLRRKLGIEHYDNKLTTTVRLEDAVLWKEHLVNQSGEPHTIHRHSSHWRSGNPATSLLDHLNDPNVPREERRRRAALLNSEVMPLFRADKVIRKRSACKSNVPNSGRKVEIDTAELVKGIFVAVHDRREGRSCLHSISPGFTLTSTPEIPGSSTCSHYGKLVIGKIPAQWKGARLDD